MCVPREGQVRIGFPAEVSGLRPHREDRNTAARKACNPRCTSRLRFLCRAITASVVFSVMWIAFFGLFQRSGYAQVASSSLSGTVTDSTGSVIPGAEVTLKNESTNAVQKMTTNASGYFSFQMLLRGTYTVSIASTGFATWETPHLALGTNESRALPNIVLRVATTREEVTVVSSGAAVAPLDTGEARTTVNQHMISQLAIQGRDAAELIKIMPGMAMNNGLSQSQWSSLVTQSNSGPVGQYSANGAQPYVGMQLTMDGGVLVDTGNQGTQVANINQDQTAELTIRTSSFDAEYSQGPVVVNATGKSGAQQFHGDAYIYGRNGSLNAEDALFKAQGLPKPIDRYWYPGGDIGGPVLIPGTNFNKNRDKLFFYGAFEYMNQHPEGNILDYVVPTPQMLQGDFSQPQLAAFSNNIIGVVPCSSTTVWNYANYCKTSGVTGGIINPASMDPNGLAYIKTFPQPNINPASHNGYNYQYVNNPPVNRWEGRGRLDYNMTQNTRAYFSYDRQDETDINNLGVWWEPSGTLPYPSSLPANEVSDLWSASVTHTFGPTMTNEVTFNYTKFLNPLRYANAGAVNPASLGFNLQSPYSPNITPALFNSVSWGSNGAMPGYWAPAFSSGFQNGAFGALKRVPSIADNLAWVRGSHTMKFGFYYERAGNQQTEGTWDINNGFPQGRYEFDNWAWASTGNPLADLLLGHAVSYAQTSADPVHTLWYTESAFYGQDHWQITRRLTLDYGVRFDHTGQWFPAGSSSGLMVWDPATCAGSTGPGPACVGSNLPGFTWHGINSNVPISGFASRLLPDPRVGAAYDLFGNGKTVLRGGFGIYRYQLAYNDVAGALDGPLGIQAFQTTCNLTALTQITSAGCAPTAATGALPGSSGSLSETALMMGDNATPYTESWNFMVDEQGPWKSLIEVGYIGSHSSDELIASTLSNVNLTPLGAYFKPDPVNGSLYCLAPFVTTGCTGSGIPSGSLPNYSPYNYGSINVNRHGSYANYNALQASWQKQTGPVTFMLNYTWSKTMGIRDGQTDNGNGNGAVLDVFNMNANYGVLAYNHTHIFNAAYVYNLPRPLHGDSFGQRLARGAVNGWELSGITQFQSGAPIQPNTGGTLNVVWGGNEGNQNILGTNAETLAPILTCNPGANLRSGQYFNPNCFAPPTVQGQNGNIIWPNVTGPGYFDSDLGVFKNFNVTERQSLQVRLEMFNFLNHPLPQFNALSNNADIQLNFDNNGALSTTNLNKTTTGAPQYAVGRRVLELSVKYSF